MTTPKSRFQRRKSRRQRRERGTEFGIRFRCGAARGCRPRGGWMRGAHCACGIRRRAAGTRRWPSMIDRQFIARGQLLDEKDPQVAAQDQQIKELKAILARYQKPRDP